MRRLVTVLVALATAGGITTFAMAAEEQKASAMAVLQGDSTLVNVGENEFMMVGALEGVMFIAANKGPLHLARIVCPLTASIAADLKQTVEGRCLISGADGDHVFASFSCKGTHFEGCAGDFKLTGGTGKLKGISGSSQFLFRGLAQQGVAPEVGVLSTKALGLAVWQELKFRTP